MRSPEDISNELKWRTFLKSLDNCMRLICSNTAGKSKIARKQRGAEKRPRFCMAFDRTSFLCRMVTACVAMFG